jgi:hypothetical protein
VKTFNSINNTALFIKVTRRENRIVGVYTPPRHSETNVFLAAIRLDYMPDELDNIIRALQTYRYDNGMIKTALSRLDVRQEHAMGQWYLTFMGGVDDYLIGTLPSESVEYWDALSLMAAHAYTVLNRLELANIAQYLRED